MLFMIRKSKLLFLFILLIAFTVNSCKKDDSKTSLTTFLTRLPWKLALKQRFVYVNSALVKTDTLENACSLTQRLTFNTDTYTYENFACTANNKINKSWSFTNDNLYLNLNSVISVYSKTNAQSVARIINLGQYSLVFDAGDIYTTNTTHLATDSVIVYRYGFIH